MAPTPERSRYRIEPVGSSAAGWQIIRDGRSWATHPSALYLGALIDALLRGADEADAFLIARTIYERPDPTLPERMMHFVEAGPWRPSQDPFRTQKL